MCEDGQYQESFRFEERSEDVVDSLGKTAFGN